MNPPKDRMMILFCLASLYRVLYETRWGLDRSSGEYMIKFPDASDPLSSSKCLGGIRMLCLDLNPGNRVLWWLQYH